MSVTISVDGIPGCGKTTLLKNLDGTNDFTVVQDSMPQMFDSITSKGKKNFMDPWAFFMEKPRARGLRFLQTMMVTKAEEMLKPFDTRFKVVERSVSTTRFVVAKFAEGLGVDDLDVSAINELHNLLVKEATLTPDMFVMITHLPTEYMLDRYNTDDDRFGEWTKGREVQHEWNRLMEKFSRRPEFEDKVVFIDGKTTKGGLTDQFLDAVYKKFP